MKNVLVLEDDLSVLNLLRRTMAEYHLIEAATAEEALLLFIDHEYQISLLFADLRCTPRKLPARSGIQVALLLRSVVPTLPVILTSNCPTSGWSVRDSLDLERLGSTSVGVLQKPFEAPILLYVVRDVIGASRTEKTRTA